MTTYSMVPKYRFISAITNAQYAVITTTEDHTYTPGEIVSFRVGKDYGMWQINNRHARVLSVTSDTLTVEMDTSTYDSYIYPVSGSNTPPVVVPSASGIIPDSNPPTYNLEDAFDNIRV